MPDAEEKQTTLDSSEEDESEDILKSIGRCLQSEKPLHYIGYDRFDIGALDVYLFKWEMDGDLTSYFELISQQEIDGFNEEFGLHLPVEIEAGSPFTVTYAYENSSEHMPGNEKKMVKDFETLLVNTLIASVVFQIGKNYLAMGD